MVTQAPDWANRVAIARPMPDAPPIERKLSETAEDHKGFCAEGVTSTIGILPLSIGCQRRKLRTCIRTYNKCALVLQTRDIDRRSHDDLVYLLEVA